MPRMSRVIAQGSILICIYTYMCTCFAFFNDQVPSIQSNSVLTTHFCPCELALGSEVLMAQRQQIFQEADIHGRGLLSYREFAQYFSPYKACR